jgi:3',5'-nucleoside bisphosphate phosphatase
MLTELHAHTTWSDGELSPGQLVDLYGRAGFDVLAITDHVVHSAAQEHVRAQTYAAYLQELDAEAGRACRRYGMLVVPGLELTVEHADPREAGHGLAIGLREFVSVDQGLEAALRSARAAGAALIAAHPYPLSQAAVSMRGTAWFAEHPDRAADLVDRFELFNREESFDWVAQRQLAWVATGDFHRPEHLFSWKTLIDCERSEEGVVAALRSGRQFPLMRIGATRTAA